MRRAKSHTNALLLAAVSLLLVAGDAPLTRWIQLKWRHSGDVAGFKVYTRHWGQEYGEGQDVGLPKQKNGVYRLALEVSNYDASYVVVTAYDAEQLESQRSNEQLHLLPDPAKER